MEYGIVFVSYHIPKDAISVSSCCILLWFERCIDIATSSHALLLKIVSVANGTFSTCSAWRRCLLCSSDIVTRIKHLKSLFTRGARRGRCYKKVCYISNNTWHQITYGPETNLLGSIGCYCSCMYMFILYTLLFVEQRSSNGNAVCTLAYLDIWSMVGYPCGFCQAQTPTFNINTQD